MVNNNSKNSLPPLSHTMQKLRQYPEQYINNKLQEIYSLPDSVQKNHRIAANQQLVYFNQCSVDYANRLKKNIRHLDKWAKIQHIECYRIYDRDLPDHRIAVDRYKDWIVIQDYTQLKYMNDCNLPQKLLSVIATTIDILKQPSNKLVIKTRTKKQGKTQQYNKINQDGNFFIVTEFNTKLWVNLTDYLDTGVFLDHRIVRKMLGHMSKDKDFLNLFSYTASASVYAGLGGAKSTTSIDMSRTYLAWAVRNMLLNNLSGQQHRLLQADCLSWLYDTKETFDLIFVHPPTFSNSKRMKKSFDIQRDHLELLFNLKNVLRTNGKLIFSNNKYGFKINLSALHAFGLIATDITSKTQPKDFNHTHSIHQCWIITHSA
ncbi:Ribosomal RNA large subunit methyltransferase K/L [Candidatus Erwinia haradaeae]|uniref:Ribosomal RNA large subunit methyltransferase K/L, partial n=1 Tax=Candidatus Erwinia haradaeae TaxID=1922217 RepID=A0A451DCY4_9GAMM|nr:Ribosomal RNA large subunit methyltransferase K/L [Candidatus Erwinia haradaeae]